MVNNKSPLRYPGGKTRACKQLEKLVCQHFDMTAIKNIISPFFGGGSFEFHLQNKYGMHIMANDKFTPLYTFWKTCKEDKNTLCQHLHEYIDKIDKEQFTHFRNTIMKENDQLFQSVMYFIINRCSFSGSTLSGGFSLEASKKRFTKSSIERIKDLDLGAFDIQNLDFQDFMLLHTEHPSNMLFLDPPYYLEKNSNLYGNNGDMHENFDHMKLHECLTKRKNWIMTYNNCDFIRNLYKDYLIIETSWSYGMNKTKESSEIVIISKI